MRRPARPVFEKRLGRCVQPHAHTHRAHERLQRLSHRQFIVDDANRLVVHRVSRVAPRSLAGPGTQPDFGQRTDRPCVGNHAEVWCRRYRPYPLARHDPSALADRPGATAAAWIILSQLHGTVRPRPRGRYTRSPGLIGAPVSTQRDAVLAVTQCHSCSPKCPNLGSLQRTLTAVSDRISTILIREAAGAAARVRCHYACRARAAGASRSRPACRRAHPPFSTDPAGASARVRTHRRLQTLAASSLPFPRIERACAARAIDPLHRRIANITASRSPAPRTSLTLESSLGERLSAIHQTVVDAFPYQSLTVAATRMRPRSRQATHDRSVL